MIVLGIDPGATTGWCVYDSESRRAVAGGEFPAHFTCFDGYQGHVDHVVIEEPVGQGPTRPEMVECGKTFGRLMAWAEGKYPPDRVHALVRYRIKSILGQATLGEVLVRNDSTAWAALKLIHGQGSDKKAKRKKGVELEQAGAIGCLVGGHSKAALAAAVAWTIQQQQALGGAK